MMSDYHVMETNHKFDAVRIAIHSPTPNGNNMIGYSYQQALVGMLTATGAGPTSAVPWLQESHPNEFAQIQMGDVTETIEMVSFDANASFADKVKAMDQYVASRMPKIADNIRRRLEYWGADRKLPLP